tara:strand:- start:1502 stop:1939 length:438 start_codon:yes stop_codon:yes gene_type:complete
MLNDFILKVVLKELLPKDIFKKFSNPSKIKILIRFIIKAINSSAIYIKGPEIIFRTFLFCLILFLKFLQLVSINFINTRSCLKKIANIHPMLDDGMRLYILLAMFAAYEDDRVRIENGFLSIKELSQSLNNIKLKSRDRFEDNRE